MKLINAGLDATPQTTGMVVASFRDPDPDGLEAIAYQIAADRFLVRAVDLESGTWLPERIELTDCGTAVARARQLANC